jgi:glycosyltransferase family protein
VEKTTIYLVKARMLNMKVFFWGIGKRCEKALDSFVGEDSEIAGFIDNNPEYKEKRYQGKSIYAFHDVIEQEFDYIVVTIQKYNAILYQISKSGISSDRVICYFRPEDCDKKYDSIFDIQKWRINLLEERVEQLEYLFNIRFNNIGYEVADKIEKEKYWFPTILDGEDAVERIVEEGCSLVRFGDGEFGIISRKNHPCYQDYNDVLAERLKQVLQSNDEKIIVAIARNYGDLDIYIEETADGIRNYMTQKTRELHNSLLKKDKIYYDAYLFKSYFPYRDKENTKKRVDMIKRIWNDRDVVIIEGDKTRTGYDNDLMDNVKSLHRILCPTQHAFASYDAILEASQQVNKDSLILVVLGPAAKPLVYDLAKKGYQAIDLGQIDMDYEWYKAGVGLKVPNPRKYVSQLPPAEVIEIEDENYAKQVIARVGV